MWKFLNTIWGSYIKISLSCMLSWYIISIYNGEIEIFNLDKGMIKELVIAGVSPFIPIAINYRNKYDSRYGKQHISDIKPDADAKNYKQ